MSSQRGQAGLEYVGVLLLVTTIIGAVALAAHAEGVPVAVHHQLLRALCVVRGGDCEQDRMPCPVGLDRREDAAGVRILVFRVGGDRTIVREERSDGTIAIHVAYGRQSGLEVGQGGRLAISVGHGGIGLGGELTASAVATRERGYTWLVHSPRAADAIVARLGWTRGSVDREVAARRLPAPDYRYEHHGVAAEGGVARAGLGGSLGLASEDVAGERVDLRTGRRTVYVQRTVDGWLSLTAGGGGVTDARRTRERYAITYDRDGRPLDLMVMTTGRYRVSAELPARLQPALGLLGTPNGHARTYVEETHLDLTDPTNLHAARAFLSTLHPGRAPADDLRHRLDLAGVVHARTYAGDERRYGIEGSVGIEGLRIGANASHVLEDSHLVGATTRGLGGTWRTRTDCLARA